MQKPKKIALIGAGKMGEAIISGLLKSEAYSPQTIRIFEISNERCRYIAETYQVSAMNTIEETVAFGDVIIVAVKPAVVESVLRQVGSSAKSNKIFVSIAAGVTLKFLKEHLPKNVEVIRAMPNVACSVGEAMIVICPSENTSDDKLKLATDVLSHLGKVLRLDEKHLNLATGLVGSGPAYIFLIIDSLADAGVRLGLPKETSTVLAAQTTLGAAKLVVETGIHPIKLKDMVATPGGTTVEGLHALEQGKLRATLMSAVTEAAKKAEALMPH